MSISLRGSSRARRRARCACRSGAVSLSTRTAQALNSAVPLFGSVTSIVSRFVSTWSGKWNVMNVSPGRSDAVDVHRRLDRAAPRGHAHDLALLEQHALGVLGRDVERLAAVQRRAVAVGLHARVVRLEPAAGREADRVLGVERLVGRLVLDRRERRGLALERLGPEARVQERRAGALLVRARPLDAAQRLELLVAHAAVHRRERAQLVPGLLGGRLAPAEAHALGDRADDPAVVARLAGRVERLAHALHAALGVRHGALATRTRRRSRAARRRPARRSS